MFFIKINNKFFFVKKNISILEACKYVGITIPRFCFQESLSVAGNCRMCLVEIEPNISLKPVSACTLLISQNLHILTDTPYVKKARENILETLLLNHPLDCPICDQGGECDLQDQTFLYGLKHSRYFFIKRSLEDKFLGSTIKTIMTRCIHCTRCVRFSDEFIGKKILGTLFRGSKTEIGTYITLPIMSNIVGNLIDLCPVGAITSKTYAFKSRPWELQIVETIDFTDSSGSNLYVSIKENIILRITPKKNKNINNIFISDKARFSFDANSNLRLLNCFFNKQFLENKITPNFVQLNWQTVFVFLTSSYKEKFNIFLISDDLNYQHLYKLIALENISKQQFLIRSSNNFVNKLNFYTNSIFNAFSFFEKSSKTCLLLSSNLKIENILLNLKIRSKYLKTGLKIFSFGFNSNSIYSNLWVSFNLNSFIKCFEAKHFFSSHILNCTNLWVIFGISFFNRVKNLNFLFYIKKKFPNIFFMRLNNAINTESIYFFNIKLINSNLLKKSKNIFAVKLTNFIFLNRIFFNFYFIKNKIKNTNSNIFWINTHSPLNFFYISVLIPIFSFFEETGNFINLEGKSQKAEKCIFNYHSNLINLNFFLLFFIKHYKFKELNFYISVFYFFIEMSELGLFLNKQQLNICLSLCNYSQFFYKYPFKPAFEDFYQTNLFTKNSLTMFESSKNLRLSFLNF